MHSEALKGRSFGDAYVVHAVTTVKVIQQDSGAHFVLQSYQQNENKAHLGVKTETNNFWINSLILPHNRQFNSPQKVLPCVNIAKWNILALWFAESQAHQVYTFSAIQDFRSKYC